MLSSCSCHLHLFLCNQGCATFDGKIVVSGYGLLRVGGKERMSLRLWVRREVVNGSSGTCHHAGVSDQGGRTVHDHHRIGQGRVRKA